MSVRLAGIGCVTPLGASPGEVWRRLLAGERVTAEAVVNPETSRRHLAAPVPAAFTAHLAREARLRRASAISLIAACAGQAAMAEGAPGLTAAEKSRLAIVFGVSSGGVQYTRRFYEQVVKQGANAASPMLFPETVYNAPASHLAAMLGVDGATYTLVGDGTVGLQALHFGAQLLELGDADYVLVVAAEELDWILLEAHHDWRLTTDGKSSGALLAEGGAAVLLARSGPFRVHLPDGRTFYSHAEAGPALADALRAALKLGPPDFIVGGGNGTWTDRVIAKAIKETCPSPLEIISPKKQLGEALGAGALLQLVLAVEGLKQRQSHRALVASLGWNQQAATAVVERAP
jgi:hypothetical protein